MTLKASDYIISGALLRANAVSLFDDNPFPPKELFLNASLRLTRPIWVRQAMVTRITSPGDDAIESDPRINATALVAASPYLEAMLALLRASAARARDRAFARVGLFSSFIIDLHSIDDEGWDGIFVTLTFKHGASARSYREKSSFLWTTENDWRLGQETFDDRLAPHQAELRAFCLELAGGLDRILTLGQPLPDLTEVVQP